MDEKTKLMSTNVDKLQRCSEEHLFYEIWMLYEVTYRLARGIPDTVMANTAVESFVIHSAIVLDFLFNKKLKPDDVIANDFIDDKDTWKKVYEPHLERFVFVSQRCHKEMAHLSYKRLEVSLDDKPWHFVGIAREISNLVDSFIDLANKDSLHPKVIGLKGAYRSNPLWRSISDFETVPMRNNG